MTFEVRAKVIAVTDGDTFVADVDVWLRWTLRASIRIAGIDTAEMRGGTEKTRADARRARDWLTGRIGGGVVVLRATGEDSFGRVLAEVYVNGEHLADEMLDLGIARPYRR